MYARPCFSSLSNAFHVVKFIDFSGLLVSQASLEVVFRLDPAPSKMGCSGSREPLPGRRLSIRSCHAAQAPMWVVRVKDVLKMQGKMVPHQVLAREGLLWRCEGLSSSWVIFVSHQWMGLGHPDPFREQLRVLQEALRGMISEELHIEQDAAVQFFLKGGRTLSKQERRQLEHAYIWLDYFSVPQMVPEAPVTREEQLKYINSIPYYVESCEIFIALVPRSVHEAGHTCGEASWLQRGWCRTEMWCKLLSDRSDIPIILLTLRLPTSSLRPFKCFSMF